MTILKHPTWGFEFIPADDTYPAALHIGPWLILF